MKQTSPARTAIRFRRWSRKAYAAFASIGRCVTIGCLRKSVADSALSKQRATGTAGRAGCREEGAWKGGTGCGEEADGTPPGGNMPIGVCAEAERLRWLLVGMPAACPCRVDGGKSPYAPQGVGCQGEQGRCVQTKPGSVAERVCADTPPLFFLRRPASCSDRKNRFLT